MNLVEKVEEEKLDSKSLVLFILLLSAGLKTCLFLKVEISLRSISAEQQEIGNISLVMIMPSPEIY